MTKQQEDTMYEIHTKVEELKLHKEFHTQIEKMCNQDKHKYKDTRDRWSYALDKVIKNHKKKVNSI